MTEELSFEVYLMISNEKYEIYLLNKKNLKNIYKEEVYTQNNNDLIDYNLLSRFLDKNIFKIEKLIGSFLRSIILVIENNQILNISIGIKKKNYEEKKASKLGFKSLYAYFENKLLQEKTAIEESARELEIAKAEAELLKEEKSKQKKTCGCC